jgi:hypothetical protein
MPIGISAMLNTPLFGIQLERHCVFRAPAPAYTKQRQMEVKIAVIEIDVIESAQSERSGWRAGGETQGRRTVCRTGLRAGDDSERHKQNDFAQIRYYSGGNDTGDIGDGWHHRSSLATTVARK